MIFFEDYFLQFCTRGRINLTSILHHDIYVVMSDGDQTEPYGTMSVTRTSTGRVICGPVNVLCNKNLPQSLLHFYVLSSTVLSEYPGVGGHETN